MSDLAAAAEALGIPEALVKRSAEARAAETGASVDDILAGWAGGEGAPAPAETAPPTEAEESTGAEESTEEEVETPPAEAAGPSATPEIVIEVPDRVEEEAPPAAPTGPYRPPVLVGVSDNPMMVVLGVFGLFIVMALVGLVGPSLPTDIPGARSSNVPYSEAAEEGRALYQSLGCAACHTQMVRPVIADVGLGSVTVNDTNQVLGTRRFGPDLSDVGSRLTAGQIEALIAGLGDHPPVSSDQDLTSDLVTYLLESRTSPPPDEESP